MKISKLKEKYTSEELADAFVFRNKLSEKESEEAAIQLAEARQKIKDKLTEKQKLYAQVLQLRFLMEDYLNSNQYDKNLTLAHFLRKYIRLNYKTNKTFANDIQLDATELSQILNHHRPPSEKTIIRFELHSNNAIPAINWYRLLEKEKEFQLQNNVKIREKENKFVKNKLIFE